MKRSKLDKLIHQREVLLKKINAYERVRKTIANLATQLKDDPYALEVLLSIDQTIFGHLRFMYAGLKKLEEEINALIRGVENE